MKTIKSTFSGLLLLVLPTIIITFPLLDYVSEYYSLLFINGDLLTLLFGIGITTAFVLHSTRLRFLLVFGLLILVLYLAYRAIIVFPFTEFDAYYIANRFRIYSAIFVIGWFTGFGISRWRYFVVFFSVILLTISIIIISTFGETDVNELVWLLAPSCFYLFYILFIKELLVSTKYQLKASLGKVLLRVFAFCLLIFLLFWGSTQLLDSKFQEIEDQIAQASEDGEGGQSDDDSMLDKDAKNMFRMKEYTQLRPRLRQSEELLFCAYIDNFIADDIPNPQYITLYHLNQYNVELERFEIDPDSVANDLFLPDPTQIPNYFVQMDSSVLDNDKMETEIRPVQSTIYINQLSPDVFVAPSTAFSCQPISVEEEFREQYRFAYNVMSEVSNLNSAYFVYNARDPSIISFQQGRYDILRRADEYTNEPQEFLDYYTRMPEGKTFEDIADLAVELTAGKESTIDKILAIRDYFLSKDENGDPLFVYTLTPGSPTDPNIPDASLLYNFLFNTKKGYCTYFATSTLFMLRSLGIPVRMAVGFMTVDRSHNNPGWYWFYADQAHAWTQVYFPEYGWLDFDMTISNEGGEQAPQPDGTPPTPPTKALFVAKGVLLEADTADQSVKIEVDQLIVKEQGMVIEGTRSFEFDARNVKVYAGKELLKFEDLIIGDTAVVVSFDQKINRVKLKTQRESVDAYLDKLPETITIQEIHVAEREIEAEEIGDEAETSIAENVNNWVNLLLGLIGLSILALFSGPYLHHTILLNQIKGRHELRDKSISIYKHSHFILNQMGIGRGNVTPMNYAVETVDPKFNTELASFIEAYLKLKYSNEELNTDEKDIINKIYPEFSRRILSSFDWKEKILGFLKFNRWFNYLINLNLTK